MAPGEMDSKTEVDRKNWEPRRLNILSHTRPRAQATAGFPSQSGQFSWLFVVGAIDKVAAPSSKCRSSKEPDWGSGNRACLPTHDAFEATEQPSLEAAEAVEHALSSVF